MIHKTACSSNNYISYFYSFFLKIFYFNSFMYNYLYMILHGLTDYNIILLAVPLYETTLGKIGRISTAACGVSFLVSNSRYCYYSWVASFACGDDYNHSAPGSAHPCTFLRGTWRGFLFCQPLYSNDRHVNNAAKRAVFRG